jgi:general secretion pathway protein K
MRRPIQFWISDRDQQRGIVLVAVLWSIVLLSALAMAASVSFRGLAGVIGIDRDRAQMDGLLSAGLEAGADLLIKSRGEWSPIETRLSLSGGVVQVSLSDERGRIDLNNAPASVLAGLFDVVGTENAEGLARTIVAWRNQHRSATPDAPSSAQPNTMASAAERARRVARANGRQGEVTPAPLFDDIHQLAQIPGIEADDIGRIEPLTTVFGGETVNPLTASKEVLRALPQMTAARIEQLMELRRLPPVDPDQIRQVLGPAAAFTKMPSQPVARIELTATLADGFAAAATAIVVVVPKDSQPYRVLAWTPHPIFAVP